MFFARQPESGVSRRAFLFMPVAFAGILAVTSRRERPLPEATAQGSGDEVSLMIFWDDGQPAGEARLSRIVRSEEDWRAGLTEAEFAVLRRKGTERAFTGRYWNNHRGHGLYRCAGCGNALFRAADQFDSGTGWPSFSAPAAEQNVQVVKDTRLLIERSEVLCAKCGGHLGHVFSDGPAPTGLRYCMNSAALRFTDSASDARPRAAQTR